MAYFKFARCIMEGKPIDLYNGGDLKRDFTYVDDVVTAIERVADQPPIVAGSPPSRIYNVGNNATEPLDHLVAALEACLGKKADKRLLPMQPGDVFVTEADISSLERDFAWKPSTPLEEGIARFARWFQRYFEYPAR